MLCLCTMYVESRTTMILPHSVILVTGDQTGDFCLGVFFYKLPIITPVGTPLPESNLHVSKVENPHKATILLLYYIYKNPSGHTDI